MQRKLCQLILCSTLLGSYLSYGQSSPANNDATQAQTQESPCDKPAEMFNIDDYEGPFNKFVARVSHKFDIKTVHVPHQHPHKRLCSLDAGDKFQLFLDDTFEPVNFLDAGWDAGWAQLANDDPTFGQGAAGYGKRYGVALLDNVSGDFFGTFFYPALFRQDPRYYRVAHGPTHVRLFHAMRHVFVAHSDSGHLMFNFSEWFGTASSKSLSNLYHPGNDRGFGTTAQRVGISIGTDMGFDVLREFWPELAHIFHLPFKGADHSTADTQPTPAQK
jgi:hypothetical protein